MNWYYVDQGQQAGPVSDEQFDGLLQSGKIQPDTLVWREGMAAWSPYREARGGAAPAGGTFPAAESTPEAVCAECGKIFPIDETIRYGSARVCAGCKPVFLQKLAEGVEIRSAGFTGFVTEEQLLARGYRVELGSSIARAWESFKDNAGMSIVAVLLCGVIMFGGGMIGVFVGAVIPLGNVFLPLLYSAPLIGGTLWCFLKLIRKQSGDISDLFRGFATRYGQYVAYGAIEAFLTYIFLIPAFLAGMGFIFTGARKPGQMEDMTPAMLPIFGLSLLVFFVGTVYISTTLSFASQLIIDKHYGCWSAIKLSFRMVHRRWWMTFAFMFVAGLVVMAGALACGVGLLVSAPVYFGMRSAIYDDNFSDLMPRK